MVTVQPCGGITARLDDQALQKGGTMKKVIYLDNAATTKVRPEVVEAMLPFYTEYYGNPSAVYEFSTPCKEALAKARETAANALGAKDNEIYFTNGGSESDNWALIATAEAYASKGKHIITTKIEHHAILHTCEYLEKRGYEITYLPAHENGIIFHTDAVQAFCHEPINVDEYHIDMLSASGHKFHGPKGVGFLYIRKGLKLRSFIHGGAQERKRRAGTENVPGIVGLGKAVEIGMAELENNKKKETELRDYMIGRVMDEIPYTRLNGHRTNRLSNNANFAFQFIEGESLLIMLDMDGICGSSGSACTSGSLDPSHVLLAIGLPHEIAHGSLRLTLSEETTKEEIDHTVDCLKKIVEKLRAMSPLYEDFIKKNRK